MSIETIHVLLGFLGIINSWMLWEIRRLRERVHTVEGALNVLGGLLQGKGIIPAMQR